MGFYIYCVVPANYAPGSLTGIDQAPVQLVSCAGLGLWISEFDSVPEPAVPRIKQHNRVVEAAISEQVTPVPVRFGQWAADRAALEQSFAPRAENFTRLLALFAGALEFGLRILDPAASTAQDVHGTGPARSGREYLAALRERLRPADVDAQLHERVQASVKDLVRLERCERQGTPYPMVSYAHLVARRDFERYRLQVRQLREATPGMRFLLSGPWPPYSFAT